MQSRYGLSVGNLLHPTDFSRGSQVAFAHALRIAVGAQGQLEILHVDREQEHTDWDSYPPVRETLFKWGFLPQDARRSAVASLGVNVSKSACKGKDPRDAVLQHIERRAADVVVLATHQREGLDRWLHGSLAETVASQTEAATLFVPYGVDGFVNSESGEVSLRRVLIPVDKSPNPQPVLDLVAELADVIAPDSVDIRLLHIGDASHTPSPTLPLSEKCRWTWETRLGAVVDAIIDDAVQNEVDLIAMTTNGHDGFLDALRGSTTEQVLHRSRCPVLSIRGSGG